MAMRIFAVLVVVVAGVLYVLVNHSVSRAAYHCDGQFTVDGKERSGDVFIALDRFRWWVVWSRSDGEAHLELPGGLQIYYPELETTSTGYSIYSDIDARGIPDGVFSDLSKSLHLLVNDGAFPGSSQVVFDGMCGPRET